MTLMEACGLMEKYAQSESQMTANKIIKALIDCVNADGSCIELATDVINRQKEEIQELYKAVDSIASNAMRIAEHAKGVRAEAIKEFAERLKEKFTLQFCGQKYDLIHGWIDTLAKEMGGKDVK